MQYIQPKNLHKPISKIIFGTAMQPFLFGGDNDDLLDAVVESGINTFDMARNYGLTEFAIGKWLEKRGNRENLVLISKCAHPNMFGRKRLTEKDIRNDLRSTLFALKTDYIDIYLLHRDDYSVPVGDMVEVFNALYNEGKIRLFGGSNWTHQRIDEANEYAYKHNLLPFSVSSPNFSLAEQINDPWGGGCVTISGKEGRDAREFYAKNQMPIIAYSSLGRGFFSGKLKYDEREKYGEILDLPAQKGYVCEENFERLRRAEELAKRKQVTLPQIALKWVLDSGLNLGAVVSASNKERIMSNVQALEIDLTSEEREYLDLRRNEL